jgi:transcriptional regulator with XRE-family HTH domain
MESDMSDKLINREFAQRVASLRKARKLTLDQAAHATGVSRSMLSQIERGEANPTLAMSFRIAEGLGVPIAQLIGESWGGPLIEVTARDDAKSIYRDSDGCRLRTLSQLHMEKDIEFYELRLEPGAELDSQPHHRGTRELLTLAEGDIEVTVNAASRRLGPGDTAHYPADTEHRIRNVSEKAALCYLVVTYP